MKPCPCGSQKSFDDCCGPLLAGDRKAETAEQLMRSRYSAYVEGAIPYLRETLHPDHRGDYDEKSSREWSEKAEWHGLEILGTVAGGPGDEEGEVEFAATFSLQGAQQRHHERSLFARRGGTWYFVSGREVKPKPVVRESPKVGRNDPCPCGSGRKHKKCCGAAA